MPGGPEGWSADAPLEVLLRQIVGPPEKMRGALREAAEILSGEWEEVLSGPGKGRYYEAGLRFITKGGKVIPLRDRSGVQRGKAHRASAPGDPPAKDSGILATSIHVGDSDPDELRVGPSNESGRGRILLALEFGVNVATSKVGEHPGGIVIEPRPSARQTLERARPKMIEAFRRRMTTP
jgi:hypothetical protein